MINIHDYQTLDAKDIRLIRKREEDGAERQLLVMQTPFGYRRVAELFLPQTEGSHAAILYIHWYEPPSPDSNRSQFVEEAKEMARRGAICLLIETLWSDPDFFLKRTQADDIQNSVEEMVNIRRAMDLLLSQPGVDAGRFALVGHDFGGMYGCGGRQPGPSANALCGHGCHASFPGLVSVCSPNSMASRGRSLSANSPRSIRSLIYPAFLQRRCSSSLGRMIRMCQKSAPGSFTKRQRIPEN